MKINNKINNNALCSVQFFKFLLLISVIFYKLIIQNLGFGRDSSSPLERQQPKWWNNAHETRLNYTEELNKLNNWPEMFTNKK
jgi:hypothetical protein